MTELQKASETEPLAPHCTHAPITQVAQKDSNRSYFHEFMGILCYFDPMHLSC